MPQYIVNENDGVLSLPISGEYELPAWWITGIEYNLRTIDGTAKQGIHYNFTNPANTYVSDQQILGLFNVGFFSFAPPIEVSIIENNLKEINTNFRITGTVSVTLKKTEFNSTNGQWEIVGTQDLNIHIDRDIIILDDDSSTRSAIEPTYIETREAIGEAITASKAEILAQKARVSDIKLKLAQLETQVAQNNQQWIETALLSGASIALLAGASVAAAATAPAWLAAGAVFGAATAAYSLYDGNVSAAIAANTGKYASILELLSDTSNSLKLGSSVLGGLATGAGAILDTVQIAEILGETLVLKNSISVYESQLNEAENTLEELQFGVNAYDSWMNIFDQNLTNGVEWYDGQTGRPMEPVEVPEFSVESTEPTLPTGPFAANSIYRFFNESTGSHFYTASAEERDSIILSGGPLNYEGVGFGSASSNVSASELIDVHRFFNTKTGTHFFTANEPEVEFVRGSNTDMNYEGVAYQALQDADSAENAAGLHRFFNSNTGAHFYTASDDEALAVQQLAGMNYEGIAYYVEFI